MGSDDEADVSGPKDRERARQMPTQTRQTLSAVGRVASRVRTSGLGIPRLPNSFLFRGKEEDEEVNSSPWGVGMAALPKSEEKIASEGTSTKQPVCEDDIVEDICSPVSLDDILVSSNNHYEVREEKEKTTERIIGTPERERRTPEKDRRTPKKTIGTPERGRQQVSSRQASLPVKRHGMTGGTNLTKSGSKVTFSDIVPRSKSTLCSPRNNESTVLSTTPTLPKEHKEQQTDQKASIDAVANDLTRKGKCAVVHIGRNDMRREKSNLNQGMNLFKGMSRAIFGPVASSVDANEGGAAATLSKGEKTGGGAETKKSTDSSSQHMLDMKSMRFLNFGGGRKHKGRQDGAKGKAKNGARASWKSGEKVVSGSSRGNTPKTYPGQKPSTNRVAKEVSEGKASAGRMNWFGGGKSAAVAAAAAKGKSRGKTTNVTCGVSSSNSEEGCKRAANVDKGEEGGIDDEVVEKCEIAPLSLAHDDFISYQTGKRNKEEIRRSRPNRA